MDAVKRFQGRHALEPDGVIGSGTIEALNVPAAVRVRQIEMALERERWLPEMRKEPHVFVNVPLFRLWAYDPARPDEPLRMNVVVGKTLGHKTPIFVDEMEYVIFRPYWSPPPSIIRSEIVPKARRDPSYLDRQNMEIVASGDENAPALPATPENLDKVVAGRLFVRQKPGEKNSLGLAKFIFPNSENVYMHGTPAQSLFARARRDFSHGCIRLEDPARLAQWVLRDSPEWTRERIDAAMRGARPTHVNLKREADRVPLLRHGLRGLEGRRVLRRRLLRPRRAAREGPGSRLPLSSQELKGPHPKASKGQPLAKGATGAMLFACPGTRYTRRDSATSRPSAVAARG